MKIHPAELETFYMSIRGSEAIKLQTKIKECLYEIEDLKEELKDIMGEYYTEEYLK